MCDHDGMGRPSSLNITFLFTGQLTGDCTVFKPCLQLRESERVLILHHSHYMPVRFTQTVEFAVERESISGEAVVKIKGNGELREWRRWKVDRTCT